MTKTQKILSTLFGSAFFMLSVLIVLETLLRKIFNVSLQGVDELSGYVLAFGATLGFASALLSANHMRIDLFYRMFPIWLKAFFNTLSVISLAIFAGFLAYVCFLVLLETHEYGSTAPTPWATPLIIPQSFWIAGVLVFATIALFQTLQVIKLLLNRDISSLNNRFGPKGVKDELATEVSSLHERSAENKPQKTNELIIRKEACV